MDTHNGSHFEWLYERLKKCLSKDETFTQSGLNRTRLATMLHTNEKYLTQAVRLYGGQSLKNLIISMRIEHACRLLVEYPNYTIDAIALECGIGARSTFYRLFRDYCGCSPNDYRKQLEESEEVEEVGILKSETY